MREWEAVDQVVIEENSNCGHHAIWFYAIGYKN